MGYFHEFPHTRNFDSDLRELLEMFESVKDLPKSWNELRKFVTNYFDNLDVQAEVNNKIVEMAADGTLAELIGDEVINEINTKLNSIIDRNVLLIGDSYSVGNDMLGNQFNSWSTLLQQHVDFKYCGVIKAGGTGFTGKEGATTGASEDLRWINHLKNYVQNTSIEILNKIGAVYILGGFNDHYAENAGVVRTRMAEFFAYAKTVLPNAKFYLAEVGWAGFGTCTTPQGVFNCGEVRDKIKRVVLPAYNSCGLYGCTYIGNLFACLHEFGQAFSGDHYHPNQNGHNFIARCLASYILGGSYSINFVSTSTMTDINGNTHTAFNSHLLDDVVTIMKGKPTASITITTPTDIPPGQGIKIGTLTSGTISGSPSLTTYCWITYDGAFRQGAIEIDSVGDVYLYNFGADRLLPHQLYWYDMQHHQ